MREDQWHFLQDLQSSGSINATSGRLNISPQALGASIRALEGELGLVLLNRSRLGVTLTEDGKQVLKLADAFWNGVYELRRQGEAAGEWADFPDKLDFWTSYGGMSCYTPRIIAKISQKQPQCQMAVYETTIGQLIEKLCRREIIFALKIGRAHV